MRQTWIICCLLAIIGLACMTWEGFYYVICKRWFPPAPVLDQGVSFRWFLAAHAFFACAILVAITRVRFSRSRGLPKN